MTIVVTTLFHGEGRRSSGLRWSYRQFEGPAEYAAWLTDTLAIAAHAVRLTHRAASLHVVTPHPDGGFELLATIQGIAETDLTAALLTRNAGSVADEARGGRRIAAGEMA